MLLNGTLLGHCSAYRTIRYAERLIQERCSEEELDQSSEWHRCTIIQASARPAAESTKLPDKASALAKHR